jgi:hypothetical protein
MIFEISLLFVVGGFFFGFVVGLWFGTKVSGGKT